MATKSRGRGYAMQSVTKGAQGSELRRPGEAGLMQRFGNASLANAHTEKPEDSQGPELRKPEEACLMQKFGNDSQANAHIEKPEDLQGPELQRQGEAGLMQRFGNNSQANANIDKPEDLQGSELRTPKEAGTMQRLGSASQANAHSEKPEISELQLSGKDGLEHQSGSNCHTKEIPKDKPVENDYINLCEKIANMDLSLPKNALDVLAEDIKSICSTSEELEKCVNNIFQFALKSKWNAHAVAVFINNHGDITVHPVKLRNLLFSKLQGHYIERNRIYLELDKFLLDATFTCEIFYHVHIAGECLKVLARPVIDYFGMLLDGASQKEVEVFVEQFPKCYENLKNTEPSGLDILLTKIRKEIVNDTTTVTVKAMLLEIFESALTDWKDLNQSAKYFYESLSKPIVRICD